MTIEHITPDQAHRLTQSGAHYLDVRTEEEFAAGHPATAVNVPLMQRQASGQMLPNPDFLAVVQRHFSKDAPLVVGCQAGVRSLRAAELLIGAGYKVVHNMQGGFGGGRSATGEPVSGWLQSNLPVCRDCGPENTYAHLVMGRSQS
jgi:rhodanese-related sulfurtransferase